MHETFIVTVQTEDGRCLIQEKMPITSFGSLPALVQFYQLCISQSEALEKCVTGPGSGTTQSASDSSSRMES